MPFCEKCGNQLAEGARFCEKCGTPTGAGAPAAPAAPVWQPPMRDPEYVIEGDSLPIVTVKMQPGECLISESGGRSWSKGPIRTETKGGGLGKALGRMISGESLFLSEYTAEGPAEITFTSSFPGQIVAKKLAPGESIIAQKSCFMAATKGVDLSVYLQKKLGAGLVGGEGFVMQKITGPGTAWMEVDGYCKEVELAAGEQIVCDTGVVALMDATCTMSVQMVKGVKNVLFGGEGLFDTVVTGPGKVWLQSMTIKKLAGSMAPFLPGKSS